MAIDLLRDKGVPLDRQKFTWKELAGPPLSKLNDDAFTRVRVIFMNGIETEANRFSHCIARMNRELRADLARVRRVEQHQQTMVNWLLPPDQSVIETTLGYEQVAIEVTASLAQNEPDPYIAQNLRFAMLEDFDHLYRYSALYDRLEGKDPNNIIQSYTDIRPGRPTSMEHRAPEDDLRDPYDRKTAAFVTKLNVLTIVAAEHQTHDYYMNVGPTYADPVGRALYAEIASLEEQHVTQYESLLDPSETLLEKWLLREAMEVYNYASCVQYETNPRIKAIWERFLEYELGHLHHVMELMKKHEKRDPAEIINSKLPDPIRYESHREFVTQVLNDEYGLMSKGTQFVDTGAQPATEATRIYRDQLNSEGSPSEIIAAGYVWRPGSELSEISSRPIHVTH